MGGTATQTNDLKGRADNAERHLLRRYPTITLAMSAAAGIHAGLWAWQSAILAGFAAVLLFWAGRRSRMRRLGWLAALCCVAAAFALHGGQQRRQIHQASLTAYLTDHWRPAALRLIVDGRVERRPSALAELRGRGPQWQSLFAGRVSAIRVGAHWRPVEGGVRVMVDGDATDYLPGDELQVLGDIQSITPPRNPGEPDMRSIYAARGQQGRVRVDSLQQLQRQHRRFQLQRPFAAFGASGERILSRHLSERCSPLAAALVLGRREAVERSTRDRLLETGTAHLLSVSGLHLGMVALAASWLLAISSISQNKQYFTILVVCIAYAAVTGGRPPVMRAALLIGAVLLGMWSGRMVHPLNALAVAALGLLLWNPANLSQVGVHLSFLAVGTLIFASRSVTAMAASGQSNDPLERLLDARLGALRRFSTTSGRRLWLAFRFSFWVWAVSAPLVWYHFHVVSPISILANVLLGLPLMVALIAGLVAVLGGVCWDALAVIPAIVCELSLHFIIGIIDALASVPLGHFWLPSPPSWWVLIFYLLIAAGLLLPATWPRSQLLLLWLVGWTCVALPLATLYRSSHLHELPDDSLEATFIDVGHGTSVLVRHSTGTTWLYDCGRLGDPAQSSRPIESVLWDRGIIRLDAIVLSHADADHYNAVPGLLQRFFVGRIITPPGMLATDERGLEAVRQAIAEAGVEVIEQHAGEQLQLDHTAQTIRILHPTRQRLAGNDNVNSLVLQIDHGGRSLILPGDLETPGTEAVMQYPRPPGSGILMAPHHGSLQQDMRPLLDWSRPRTVVVSGGTRAGRPEVLQRLAQNGADVYVTSLQGAITTRIESDGTVTVQPWWPGEQVFVNQPFGR